MNCSILLAALKEMGGSATVRELNAYLWLPQNRVRFQRHGRAWSEKKAQHEIFYLKETGLVEMLREGKNCFRYSVAEERAPV